MVPLLTPSVSLVTLFSVSLLLSGCTQADVIRLAQDQPWQSSVLIPWGNRTSNCSQNVCDNNTFSYDGPFDCGESNTWPSSMTFFNPVPNNFVITGISFTFGGHFSCDGLSHSIDAVLFNNLIMLQSVQFPNISKMYRKDPPDPFIESVNSRLLNNDGTPNTPTFTKRIDFNDIQLRGKIGKGTFGEVYKGIWNGTEVGVKFLTSPNVNDQFLNDFHKEVQIMRSLRHPNILQFLGTCTSLPNICIVMEYMPMGSLFKILHDDTIKRIDINLLKRMMMDASRGMNYLHKSDPMIIHRDLKSHNLLVDENWKVKVCDFGLSKILETQSDFTTMTACGTPSWTAPEILRNEKYTEKADIYSFGIVLWECMSREDPYYGMPPFQVVLAVGTRGMRPTIPSDCPPQWAELIENCWTELPEDRPSFDDIMIRLEEF